MTQYNYRGFDQASRAALIPYASAERNRWALWGAPPVRALVPLMLETTPETRSLSFLGSFDDADHQALARTADQWLAPNAERRIEQAPSIFRHPRSLPANFNQPAAQLPLAAHSPWNSGVAQMVLNMPDASGAPSALHASGMRDFTSYPFGAARVAADLFEHGSHYATLGLEAERSDPLRPVAPPITKQDLVAVSSVLPIGAAGGIGYMLGGALGWGTVGSLALAGLGVAGGVALLGDKIKDADYGSILRNVGQLVGDVGKDIQRGIGWLNPGQAATEDGLTTSDAVLPMMVLSAMTEDSSRAQVESFADFYMN